HRGRPCRVRGGPGGDRGLAPHAGRRGLRALRHLLPKPGVVRPPAGGLSRSRLAPRPRPPAATLVKLSPERRLDLAVAACAAVVYLGALWNGFALDDRPQVVFNPLLADWSGIWRAFSASWWASGFGGQYYRPLTVATLVLDARLDGAPWFHLVNVLWHVAATLTVAALARRWAGARAGLIAGLLFAVHPVHVEAVANVVGRGELMAALWTLLAVYAAVVRESPAWSGVALACGLLSKADAAVAAALAALAWVLGVTRPPRRTIVALAAAWAAAGGAYAVARWAVLHTHTGFADIAPVFQGADGLSVRLAAGAWLGGLRSRLVPALVGLGVVAAAARTAWRVPVWRDDTTVTVSILADSPRSYRGPQYAGALLQAGRNPARALAYYRAALALYDRDSRLF